MIKDISYKDYKEYIKKEEAVVLLLYASMCGTCEVAKKMLDVLSQNMTDIEFIKMNVNLNQKLITDHNVSSVPCFILFKNGEIIDQFYAFNSITFLYEKVRLLKGN